MWIRLKATVQTLFAASREEPRLSRRDFLTGMGVLGAIAVAGPALLATGSAKADVVDDLLADGADGASDPNADLAQYYPPRRRRRRRRRRHRGRRRRRERMSARDLRRRCRRDWRFRRRNWDLCERARDWRGRYRGACIQIGPVQICE